MGSVQWVDRASWGADPLRVVAGHAAPHAQFSRLVSHHTVMTQLDWDSDAFVWGDLDDICAYMRALQRARPDLGLEVPYNFVIFPGETDDDCVVCEGRGWGRTGAHTSGMNSSAYGVAWAGDFTEYPPTPGMIAGVRWLGAQLADPIGAAPTIGHCDAAATACPGAAAIGALAQMQPPFTTITPSHAILEGLLVSNNSFQLIGDGGLVITFVPGQRSVSLGGLAGVHVALNSSGAAPVAGYVPQDELIDFAERWDNSVDCAR